MPNHYVNYFKEAGFDVLSIANNHVSDFGETGKENTVKMLDGVGIKYAGLLNYPYTTFEKNGIKYGFCAFAPNNGTVDINDSDNAAKIVKQLNSIKSLLVPTLDYKVYVGRDNLKFQYIHRADYESRIDPGASNIMDIYVLTKSYDTLFRQWLDGSTTIKPLPPSSAELYNLIAPKLNLIKSISDEIVYHPVTYKLLFGATASIDLQASFKVTKSLNSVVSENDIRSRAITAINQFFTLDNWNFGDIFYFTELSTYVMTQLSPDITNFIIVPRQDGSYFGSLFEIKCPSDQIFVSSATVDDIEIITGITSGNIKSVTGQALSAVSSQNTTSSTYGNI
jgi:hypothetical protein